MKYDSGDLDAIQSLAKERGWQLIRERMLKAIDQMVNELIQPSTPEKTAELRGQIAGVRLCLLMAKILEDEIRKKMTEAA